MNKKEKLLEVSGLQTHFETEKGTVPAVDGVSFNMNKGEVIAIVGESGSGKSVTSFSILGLIKPPGKIVGGNIKFKDKELTTLSKRKLRKVRGNEISMIFQEPLTSLNPVFTVGNQIAEVIILHQRTSKSEAKKIGVEMLKKVGIPRPDKVFNMYPHSLSGGMRQRVMIAMALSCNPELLIADEPTTALDVTIQAQILKLMRKINKDLGTSIIVITHDLGVVAEVVDKVVVMYAGQVVEESDVFTLFKEPKHPYTKGLIESTPKVHERNEDLISIRGNVPVPTDMPQGCRFHPRCPYAMEICKKENPKLETINNNQIRCWLYDEEVTQSNENIKQTN